MFIIARHAALIAAAFAIMLNRNTSGDRVHGPGRPSRPRRINCAASYEFSCPDAADGRDGFGLFSVPGNTSAKGPAHRFAAVRGRIPYGPGRLLQTPGYPGFHDPAHHALLRGQGRQAALLLRRSLSVQLPLRGRSKGLSALPVPAASAKTGEGRGRGGGTQPERGDADEHV